MGHEKDRPRKHGKSFYQAVKLFLYKRTSLQVLLLSTGSKARYSRYQEGDRESIEMLKRERNAMAALTQFYEINLGRKYDGLSARVRGLYNKRLIGRLFLAGDSICTACFSPFTLMTYGI